MPLHRVFCHLHRHWPSEWQRSVTGDAGVLGAWWGSLDRPGDPRWQAWRLPLLAKAAEQGVSIRDLLQRAVPLALHADGVRVFKRKNLMVWSAVSLTGSGTTKDLKLLMQSYWANMVCKGSTAETDTEIAVWKAAKWDLEACYSGLHPAEDHNGLPWPVDSAEAILSGTPWAAGAFAIPWVIRGDLDQFAKWKLESTAGNRPCPWCKGNRTTLPWTDFRPQALWKDTCWQSDAEWRAAHADRHPMFDCLHLGLHSCVVDGPLHTIALGVAQHCTANVLMQLVWDAVPRALGPIAQRLAHVSELVQDYFAEHRLGSRVGQLELGMFCEANWPHAHYPELKCKGKESENLTAAVHWVWLQYADDTLPEDCSISEVMGSLCAVFELCKEPGMQLTGECKDSLMHHTDNLLAHYTALGNLAGAQGRFRWNCTPKFHMMWHWSRQCRYLHPRQTSCYVDEDFVGTVKCIGLASTGGTAIAQLPNTIMLKYMRGMMLRWHKFSRAHSTD